MGKQRTQHRARTAGAPRLRKREVLRLAERLRTNDLSFKGYSILPNSCWIQGPPEVVARGEAATALGEFGAEASPAIPALVQVLADQNVCRGESDCHWPWQQTVSDLAAGTLATIGRPAVPALIAALASPNAHVRQKAAGVLEEIGAPAASAASALAECVRADQDQFVRMSAAHALGAIGAKAALRVLLESLHDQDGSVRGAAAAALGQLGQGARRALPTLVRQLADDPDPAVRCQVAGAVAALGRFPPRTGRAMRTLAERLQQDPSDSVRAHLASVLTDLAPRYPRVRSVLIAALGDQYVEVRRVAANALLQLDWPANAVVPTLQEVLKWLRSIIPGSLAKKMPRLGKTVDEAVSTLAKVLGMKMANLYLHHMKVVAIRALGAIGPRAQAAVPALNAILPSGTWDEQEAAKEALVRIQPEKGQENAGARKKGTATD